MRSPITIQTAYKHTMILKQPNQRRTYNQMNYYQVEAILDRKVYSGKVLYLTQWKNSSENPTWESIKTLKGFRHLVREYQEKSDKVKEEHLHPECKEATSQNVVNEEEHQQQTTNVYEEEQSPQQDRQNGNSKQDSKEEGSRDQNPEMGDNSVIPQVLKRKRGRPPKQVALANVSLTNIGTSKKLFEIKEIYQESSSKSVKGFTTHVSKAQEEIHEDMIQKNNELLRIYYCERNHDGNVEYIIEQRENQLRKCDTKELMRLYADQLVDFLEKAVLSKEQKYPSL